jgi:hypothetical protein
MFIFDGTNIDRTNITNVNSIFMKIYITIIASFCLGFFQNLHSQSNSSLTSKKEIVGKYLQNYFHLDRQIIHVQFNKQLFINNEDITFKGYVFNKNKKALEENTFNVQLIIYDNQKQIIDKQLILCKNGIFTGGVHLNDKFKSGKYNFQFFTNWMNNFIENDSFVQTIEIIDRDKPFSLKSNEINWKTAQVTFFPECGKIIDNIFTTVAVKIEDCNKKGIELNNIHLLDSKSNIVSSFSTNKMGNGLFYFLPNKNEKYTLKIDSKELKLIESLPQIQDSGILISYNNNLNNDRVAVAIKTNKKGLDIYQNKKFILLVQQDGNCIQNEINFNNHDTETEFIFDKKYLSTGVNSIRLIDENLNEISERLIFNYPKNFNTTNINTKFITKDTIKIKAETNFYNANLSISILPEKNQCIKNTNSILGTFYLNAYLKNPVIDNYSYFDPNNSNRKKEMEMLMLSQSHSKYIWKNIISNPPLPTYPLKKGITFNGQIDKSIKPDSKYKISLVSLKDNVLDETDVDQNNEFKFENIIAKDSTLYLFQLVDKKNSVIPTKIQGKISDNEMVLNHPLQSIQNDCPIEKSETNSFYFSKTNNEESIVNLNEVIIKKNKKEIFKHSREMSLMATAYKISDKQHNSLLDFLKTQGYRTGINPRDNTVYIQSNRPGRNINPSIYIDNYLISDFNELFNLNMQDIDELYIDKTGLSEKSSDSYETIKIFLKKERTIKNGIYSKYSPFFVTNGLSNDFNFNNIKHRDQNEFNLFGCLFWESNLNILEENKFEFQFPVVGNQKEIQALIEGINIDGQLISEMKIIPISNP